MTVTLSYNHGFMEDCGENSISDYTLTKNGSTATLTSDNDNEFDMEITAHVGDFQARIDCANISTDTFTKYRFRYKTSSSSIKAKVALVFVEGGPDTQTILAETSNTSWTIVEGTVTAGYTLDKIRFFATQAVGHVWYDFLIIYADDFSLGNTAFGMDMDFPPKTATLTIPSGWTDRPQNLGSANTLVRISCDLTQDTWKRGPAGSPTDTIDAEVFLESIQNTTDYPWRWFDSGKGLQFKVYKIHPHLHWESRGDETVRRLDLTFEEYSRGDLSGWGHDERWGIE